MTDKKEKSCANISTILLIGSFCAAGLLVLGLGMLVFRAQPEEHLATLTRPDFSNLLSHLLRGESVGVISLGILVMMFTPLLRVVVAAFSFFWEKDFRYAAVAVGVMLILLFTIIPNFL
jgi:uncharacterized membrane protein